MQVESLVPLNPEFDLRMLVRGIVVHDQMQVHSFRGVPVHLPEKLEKFLVPVAIKAGADYRAIQHIERCKQRRRSVSNIVVGQRSTASFFHRQTRLSSIQCLNLGFFVHAQNQRLIRWIQIQTGHVGEFFHKLLVAGQLEIANAMGLQTVAEGEEESLTAYGFNVVVGSAKSPTPAAAKVK